MRPPPGPVARLLAAARLTGVGRRGTYAFTACIQRFGAVTATGMGIGRKVLSVLLSYLMFPKTVLAQHVVRGPSRSPSREALDLRALASPAPLGSRFPGQ